MRFIAVRSMMIMLTAVVLVGCQSGPRFAWWKKDKTAPEDTSLVARSAAPALPSSQTMPSTVATAQSGATPPPMATAAATPPSAASVPAASAGAIFAPPTASYAGGTSGSASSAAPLPAGSTTPPAAASPAAATPTPPVVAQAAPYNPNAYQSVQSSDGAVATASQSPATQPTTNETGGDRYGDTVPDRYAASSSTSAPATAASPATAAGVPASATPSRYSNDSVPAPNGNAAGASAEDDRYAMTPVAPAGAEKTGAAATATPSVPALPASGQQAAAPSVPVAEPSQPASAANNTLAAVRLEAPPGQYRPGGTSSYAAGVSSAQTEIASRPSAHLGGSSAPSVPAATTLPRTPAYLSPTAPTTPQPTTSPSVPRTQAY